MMHPRQHITDFAVICREKGISKIVISPGSRSAPLIHAFVQVFGEDCISLVDERSAAFFGLGLALSSGKPVALICTSGTAVLNYAPAIAEAYHQHIPLMAITADRPHEWIDQQDNQTLQQKDIYRNYIKRSYELPQVVVSDDDLWYAHRIINEAIDICTSELKGPVHINVPLTEPLYGALPERSLGLRMISRETVNTTMKLPPAFEDQWKKAGRILIIHGQDNSSALLKKAFGKLLDDKRVVIVAENISNTCLPGVITNSNLLLSVNRENNPPYPDLIIHSGGQVVSKALTGYLRRAPGTTCWRIGMDINIIDTFKLTRHVMQIEAGHFYQSLSALPAGKTKHNYHEEWNKLLAITKAVSTERLNSCPFADIHVYHHALNNIPDNSLLVLGNSSVIRYSQLFPVNESVIYFSNRGTSGIDGSLSTASGIASDSGKLTIAIIGDLGFLYDSNALWNNRLPSNLRILVVNNQGGGIFHILKGPSDYPGFKKFIEAHHPVNIAKLAEAYGIIYLHAVDEKSLGKYWSDFTGMQHTAVILEVNTNAIDSATAFRKLMAGIR